VLSWLNLNSNPQRHIRITLTLPARSRASWGQASLLFQGKAHRFRVSGLKVLSVGVRRIALRGDVYNLTMSGTLLELSECSSGPHLIRVKGLVLQNDRGVTINLVAQQRGLI